MCKSDNAYLPAILFCLPFHKENCLSKKRAAPIVIYLRGADA